MSDAMFSAGRVVRVHAADPDFSADGCALKFTLTYEGRLNTGKSQSAAKHERRRIFHRQLKRLWDANSLLAKWMLPIGNGNTVLAREALAQSYAKFPSYKFVPLITHELSLESALHFHILRPTTFKGSVFDSDNIVKIIADSLKTPQNVEEMDGAGGPSPDEFPFFVLMQDDGLISKISSTADELLQPVLGKEEIERNDVRIMIDVYVRPNFPNYANIIFFSDDFEVWNHNWANGLDGIRGWSNSELKARVTQCVLRMRITAGNFRMQSDYNYRLRQMASATTEEHQRIFLDDQEKYLTLSNEQHIIWNGRLRPIAVALKEELQKRVYGQPPYPDPVGTMRSIDSGMLTGPDPIGDGATGLESLMRQLQ